MTVIGSARKWLQPKIGPEGDTLHFLVETVSSRMTKRCCVCGALPENCRLFTRLYTNARGRRFHRPKVRCQDCGLILLDKECHETRSVGFRILLSRLSLVLCYGHLLKR